jgi:hypothetical protein
MDYTDLPLNASSPQTTVPLSTLGLQHNTVYGFKVLGRNTVGLVGSGLSPGWRHDLTKPIPSFIYTYEAGGPTDGMGGWVDAPGASTFLDAVPVWNGDGTDAASIAAVARTYGRISPWNRTWETDLTDADERGYLVVRVPRLYFNATSPGKPYADMLFRFAAYDAESHIARMTASIGRSWGGYDVFTSALRWESASTALLTPTSPPGLYNFRRYKQYFEGVFRFPTTGIPHATRLYVTARVYNYAGTYSWAQGRSSFIFDATPPFGVPKKVVNGPKEGGLWAEFTNVTTSWKARLWDACVEYESGIRYWYVGLGSTPGLADLAPLRRVMGWEIDQVWPQGSLPSPLPHGRKVYVTAICQNWAGLNTSVLSPFGVTVDATPPPTGAVYDGSPAMGGSAWSVRTAVTDDEYGNNGDIDYVDLTTGAFANWASQSWEDTESGVGNYFFRFDSAGLGPLTSGWVPNGPATAASWALTAGVNLPHNDTVTASVRSVNRAGSASVPSSGASSNGVRIDTTPPLVSNATLSASAFAMLNHSTVGRLPMPVDHTVSFSCRAYEDVSPLVDCAYAVGTCPGCADAVPWTTFAPLGTRLPAQPAPYQLLTPALRTDGKGAGGSGRFSSGALYWGACRCYSGAGGRATSVTPAFSVDNDGPFIGTVFDAPSTDVNQLRTDISFTQSGDKLVVSFPAAADVVTPVVDCAVALGTDASAPGRDMDVLAWTSVGATARFAVLTGLSLPAGVRAVASVRCTDAANNTAVARSNGVTYDPTAPTGAVLGGAGIVTATGPGSDNPLMLAHQRYVPDATAITCRLNVTDRESGIASVQVGLATAAVATAIAGGAATAPDVANFATVPVSSVARIAGLTLSEGATVHCVARVSNGGGLTSTFVSAAITVDTTAPACPSVLDLDPLAAGYTGAQGSEPLPTWLAGSTAPTPVTSSNAAQSSLRLLGAGLLSALTCADAQSGLVKVEVGVGSTPGAPDVVPLATVFTAPADAPAVLSSAPYLSGVSAASVTVSASPSGRLYTLVRVTSGAGTVRVFTSSSAVIDITPPTLAPSAGDRLRDGPDDAGSDISFSADTSSLRINFAVADAQSGVGSLRVGLLWGTVTSSATASFGAAPMKATTADGSSTLALLNPDALAFSTLSTSATSASLAIPGSIAATVAAGTPVALAVVMSATNSLGLESRWRTDGVVLTAQPPACACPVPACANVFASGTGGATSLTLALTGPAQYWTQDADGSAVAIAGSGSLTARFACADNATGITRVDVQPQVRDNNGLWSSAGSSVTSYHYAGALNVSSVALTDALPCGWRHLPRGHRCDQRGWPHHCLPQPRCKFGGTTAACAGCSVVGDRVSAGCR